MVDDEVHGIQLVHEPSRVEHGVGKNNLEISDKQVEKLIQIAGQASSLSAEDLDKVVGGGWHGNPWFETS